MATEYVRTGRGDAIVLVAAELDSAEITTLVSSLADRHLVLAACPATAGDFDLSRWFSAFLEGLGLPSAHLFVHSSVTPSFVPGDPDHV
jgi:hypothetical protein